MLDLCSGERVGGERRQLLSLDCVSLLGLLSLRDCGDYRTAAVIFFFRCPWVFSVSWYPFFSGRIGVG